MEILPTRIVSEVIQPRPAESHKGTYGRVLLVGGNETYGGAIILAASACVYAGAGLTTVATNEKNHGPLHARLPEAMVIDWQQTEEVTSALKVADVVVVGPGMGTDAFSLSLLQMLLTHLQSQQICIIDGSAITLLGEFPENFPQIKSQIIFTPHEKEWERLSGLTIPQQTEVHNREAANKIGGTIVLKKHRTEIYLPEKVYQNPLGTPAMATGGMGDTLAGMIAGFTAQFKDKEAALLAAVYLHSEIGEEIAEKNYVALPTEIIQRLPSCMKRYEGEI